MSIIAENECSGETTFRRLVIDEQRIEEKFIAGV
jgi:hypothetical protein